MDPNQPTQPAPTSTPATELGPSSSQPSRTEHGRAHVRLASDAPAVARVPWLASDAQAMRWLAGLGVLAVVLAKGLAPALRGWKSGIGSWIARADNLAALISQLLIVCAVMACFRLLLATLRERKLPALQRLVTVPAAAGVLTLAVAASKADLTPKLTLTIGCASSLVTLISGFRALHLPRTRALGLVLGMVGTASMIQTAVRAVALEASDRALADLFDTARALATLGFVLFVVAVAVVVAWLLAGMRYSAIAAGAALLTCALLAWLADAGSRYGATGMSYLFGRTLMELSRPPSPLIAPLVRNWVLLVSLAAASAAVLWPGRDRLVQACLALGVLTGVEADIPVLGLLLVLAALSAALASTMDGSVYGAGSEASSAVGAAPSGSGASGA
ncbi:MAG: hypothetical protein JW940_29945 [Polyangiaceae bacterium]|nr:hypothetical protein [Polyangiaceae bacterium]